jgi:hypothetical protein
MIKKLIRYWHSLFVYEPPSPAGLWRKELDESTARAVKSAITALNKIAGTDYDRYIDEVSKPVTSPVVQMLQAIENDKAVLLPGMKEAAKIDVDRAVLYEARVDDRGRLMPERLCEGNKPYRLTEVSGLSEFKAKINESLDADAKIKMKAPIMREAKRLKLKETMAQYQAKLKEANLLTGQERDVALATLREDFVDVGGPIDSITTSYDRSQFTEFAPLFGNQFYKQQYYHDMLQTFALSYEAWNHNPLAKRIVNHLCGYVVGRGVKLESKNMEAQEAWEVFAAEIGLLRRLRYWFREYIIYGEILLNKANWQPLDPSSVWEVIHVPENVDQVLYYYQAFLSDYQMFVGYKIPGVPGSENVPTVKFTINQIPGDQIIHMKTENVSNEKRGRSKLFPILGWLKRYKDYMTARVVKSQLEASFIWDDLIVGDDADVQAHANANSGMPVPGTVFAHNERVTRTPMKITEAGSGRADILGDSIIAFIATAMGIPKEHLNVMGTSNRASALVSSEPFTKVIEELQTEFEELLHMIASIELPRRGVQYDRDEIEFVFPSVTKDTTSETIQNIMLGEQQGYISQRRAAGIYASELDITTYDFETEQKQIADDKAAGLDLQGPPPPTAAKPGFGGDDSDNGDGGSDIHGSGKGDLEDNLMTL